MLYEKGGQDMEVVAIALFAAAVAGIPIAILLCNGYGKKRGCGRGCATCGNRDICYRRKKKQAEDE